jgi:hypothetical protein
MSQLASAGLLLWGSSTRTLRVRQDFAALQRRILCARHKKKTSFIHKKHNIIKYYRFMTEWAINRFFS